MDVICVDMEPIKERELLCVVFWCDLVTMDIVVPIDVDEAVLAELLLLRCIGALGTTFHFWEASTNSR